MEKTLLKSILLFAIGNFYSLSLMAGEKTVSVWGKTLGFSKSKKGEGETDRHIEKRDVLKRSNSFTSSQEERSRKTPSKEAQSLSSTDDAKRLAQEKKLDSIDKSKLKAARAQANRRIELIDQVKSLFSKNPNLKPTIAENTYLHGKEKDIAIAATMKGGDHFHNVLSGNLDALPKLSEKPTKQEKAAYKEALHDMSWYLFNTAAKKDSGKGDKGMASGMILLEGPEATHYHKYIENYVKKVSPYPEGKLIGLDKFESGAYERESSHFNGCRKTSYGIDLDAPVITRPDAKGNPSFKSHLHVGQLEDGRVFVKFERYGLGKKEFLDHAGGFVTKDLIPKLKAKFKGDDELKEKSIRQLLDTGEIKHSENNAIANHEIETSIKANPKLAEEPEGKKSSLSLQRGEKWPKGYNALFESSLKEKGVSEEEIKTIMKDVKAYGLQAMHKHGNEKGLEITHPETGEKVSFSESLEKKYGPDVKNKFFNEVVLNTADLKAHAESYHQALKESKSNDTATEQKSTVRDTLTRQNAVVNIDRSGYQDSSVNAR